MADCLWKSDRFREAGEKYKEAMDINPGLEAAYKGYGDFLWKTERKEEAIKKFETMTIKFPNSAEGYRMLGWCYWKDGNKKEAKARFEEMTKRAPWSDSGYRTYGEFLWETGNPKDALEKFRKMVDSNTNSEENFKVYGEYLWKNGQYGEAIWQFDRMIELNPLSKWGYQTVLKLMTDERKYEEAIEFFEKRLQHIYDDTKVKTYMEYSKQSQLYEKFLKQFEELIYNNPIYSTVYLLYGQFLERKHCLEDALFAYLKYIKVAVDSYGTVDINQLHQKHLLPLLDSIDTGEYIKQFFMPKERKLSELRLYTLLLLKGNYEVVKDKIPGIIEKYTANTGVRYQEFDLFLFVLKLNIWLHLYEEDLVRVRYFIASYLDYVKALAPGKEKNDEMLKFYLELYDLQLKLDFDQTHIRAIFEQIRGEENIPFNLVILNIWTCLVEPNSLESQKYKFEKPVAAVVEQLEKMSLERHTSMN
jgi:tetratricopeptide (TPR) repeat protein